MNNLYVVESPLQALCALEVSLSKKGEQNFIIAKLSDIKRDENNQQILKVINLGVWDKKVILNPSKKKNNIITDHISQLKELSKIKKVFGGKIGCLYIGEFRYQYMHMVRCAINPFNVYLLDDGAATVNVIKKYIENKKYYPEDTIRKSIQSSFPKRIFYNIFYKNYLNKRILEKEITVLTAFFEESNDIAVRSLKFNNIALLKNKEQKKDSSLVYYYGSYYSENSYISLEYEINFLTKIIEFYDKKHKEIIYFAHRDESERKLSILTQHLQIEVKQPTEMAELFLINSLVSPGEVAGAYTSILNNVKFIFPEMSIRSFRLDQSEIRLENRLAIGNIYDYYHRIGIDVKSFTNK
ncbi:hypothetical protein [Psychrobacter namhaensis]|uniref:hypothetical protein n=1 Tax=Psychrobacter namhaensis TaxID=292734 RepID=UPI003CFC3EB9